MFRGFVLLNCSIFLDRAFGRPSLYLPTTDPSPACPMTCRYSTPPGKQHPVLVLELPERAQHGQSVSKRAKRPPPQIEGGHFYEHLLALSHDSFFSKFKFKELEGGAQERGREEGRGGGGEREDLDGGWGEGEEDGEGAGLEVGGGGAERKQSQKPSPRTSPGETSAQADPRVGDPSLPAAAHLLPIHRKYRCFHPHASVGLHGAG